MPSRDNRDQREDVVEEVKPRSGISGKFLEFIKEVGKEKISNPNPKSRNRFPYVQVTTLSNSKEGKKVLKKMFEAWLLAQKDPNTSNKPSPKKDKKESPKKTKTTLKEIPFDKKAPKPKLLFKVSSKDVDKFISDNKKIFEDYKKNPLYNEKNMLQKYENSYQPWESLPEEFTISDKEKDISINGPKYGKEVSKILTAKHKKVYTELFGDGGWIRHSFSNQSALLQGVLSHMGVEGHLAPPSANYADAPSDVNLYNEAKKNPKEAKYEYSQAVFNTENIQSVVKDLYVATQAFFKSQGIKEITIFRGVKHQINNSPPEKGDSLKLKSRELSSWSTNPTTAAKFGGYNGRTIAMKIPVEYVLGGFITDPVYGGSHISESIYNESELMILGSSNLDATVIK